MPNPQFIAQIVLPAMREMLGASNVMQEAAGSEPNMEHFDPNNAIQATPLVDTPGSAAPTHNITPDMPGA